MTFLLTVTGATLAIITLTLFSLFYKPRNPAKKSSVGWHVPQPPVRVIAPASSNGRLEQLIGKIQQNLPIP